MDSKQLIKGFHRKDISPESTELTEHFFPKLAGYNQIYNAENSYVNNNDVYSVVRRIAKTAAMIPLNVYKVKDQGAKKDYDFISKNNDVSITKKMLLKSRALEALPLQHPLVELLENPNPVQSKIEFREGVYTYRLTQGNSLIWTPKLELGVNAGKFVEMWLIPSQGVRYVIKPGFPPYIDLYQTTINQIYNFTPDEILHIRYFNPDAVQPLIGLSPLRAGRKILSRSENELKFSDKAFANSGISGIVYNENADELDIEQASKLKANFYKEVRNDDNIRQLLFEAGKIGYIPIGLSPADMNVIESEKMTFKKLCNLYGVSDNLFNNDKAGTENNVKEMVRALYSNAALPEVYAFRDILNLKVCPLYDENLYIDADITGITELQEDMKRMAEIFAQLPIMIPNNILEAFGYDKSDDDNMNKIYVKAGYQSIDDLENIPLTNDYRKPGNGN